MWLFSNIFQTAKITGKFGVGEQIVSVSDDMCMVREGTASSGDDINIHGNRQSNIN